MTHLETMKKSLSEILKEVETASGLAFEGGLRSVSDERLGGEIALHVVAKWGYPNDVRTLVEAGSDVNKKGEDGNTPLHYAAMMGQFETVKALVELGAKPSKDMYGYTQADVAVRYPAIQAFLRAHGF